MNISSIIQLTLLLSLILLGVQRIQTKWRTAIFVLLLLPNLWFFWRWSIFNDHLSEYYIACGASLVLNIAFWLIYGRKNPPGSKGEIVVFGEDD